MTSYDGLRDMSGFLAESNLLAQIYMGRDVRCFMPTV